MADNKAIVYYNIGMAIEFTESADKHGIPHEYAMHVLTHALNHRQTDGRPGEEN